MALLHKDLGLIYCRSGDLKNGLTELLEAQKLTPADPDVARAMRILQSAPARQPPHADAEGVSLPERMRPSCGVTTANASAPRTAGQRNRKSVINYVYNVDANPQENAAEPRGLLKENIAARLREEILAGRIAPGQKIIEGRWARQYGVAQVSIREALNILTVDGFVTKGHGRSARVVNLDDADITHIYGVRGVLEGLAARIITQRKLPVDDLETAFAALQTEVQKNDLRGVIGSVQGFHLLLFEKPGNPFLQEYGRRLVIPLYAFTLIRALAKNLTASPWDQQLSKHRLIIDVIKLGDPSLAEQTLIHVTNSFLEAALTVWAH